jgi:hypothetical protein
MIVNINTANSVDGHDAFVAHFESTMRTRLSRFEGRLTRVEVHFGDANSAQKNGDDKSCVIEARPAGMDPVTTVDQQATHDRAASGALDKLVVALERAFGKQTTRKGH